jgi:hypothetical protein
MSFELGVWLARCVVEARAFRKPEGRGFPTRSPSGSEERRRREEGAKIGERVRKLESERVKDAHQLTRSSTVIRLFSYVLRLTSYS